MSEHNTMGHKTGATPNREAGGSEGLSRILRSRYLAVGVTIAALLVGLLIARRFGLGGRLVVSVGLAALMMIGNSFMHGGHGTHGRRDSHGEHGGCGTSSRQRAQGQPAQQDEPEKNARNGGEVDARYSPRRHFGCH